MPKQHQPSPHSYRLALALCVAVVSLSAVVVPARAEEEGPDAKFRKAVREYLLAQQSPEQMGMSVAYGAANEALMAIAQSGVEITEPIQAIVLEQAVESYGSKFGDVDFLVDLLAPVYAQHYTEKEIQTLVEFYRTPVGKKSIALAGPINEAGVAAVQQSAVAIAPDFQLAVAARLDAAGFSFTSEP
jgi:hypothetical protein